MPDRRKPPGEDIADANSLYDEDDEPAWEGKPSHPRPASKPSPAPSPATPPVALPAKGEYEVEGMEPDDDPPPPVPRPPIAAPKRAGATKPKVLPDPDEFDDEEEDFSTPEEANVEEIWTRWGEWGPTLTMMGIVGAIVLVASYFAANSISFGIGVLIFLLGGFVLVLMSYPIAITLERPMRLTPEQAVKDFYASASHHFPQFRRMWLLLSEDGRMSPEFDSFASFRAYWARRMSQIRSGAIKNSTPLAFFVKEFQSDKSAGKTVIEADYTVAVHARGTPPSTAREFPISTTMARGPDKMWYLNSGILPEPVAPSRGRGTS